MTKAMTKTETVRRMLATEAGASLAAICAATGWQAHSARAALSGLRKAGCAIERTKSTDGETAYRITAGPGPRA
ncbi:MAG: DUF3489 domain-containing protein [Rhodobacteraceae bacterium]|nr:DUF3489 domain-containing protein [Paracoccaceae bacterium]